jgi:hypothetical protein
MDKIVEILRPDVSTEAKLTGVALFFNKWLEKTNRRVVDLEARQLQKGDKGDKGDDAAIDYKLVKKQIDEFIGLELSKEDKELSKLMERTWNKW